MDRSDSENEDFLSADEFASDDETVSSTKIRHSLEGAKVPSVPPCVLSTLVVREKPLEGTSEKVNFVQGDLEPIESLDKESCTLLEDVVGTGVESFECDEEPTEVPSYRKRPERPKKIQVPASKKTELKPIINIVKVARPDAIMNDLKSQLTTNISKGFATFQETSSSLKGLVLGNFVPEEVQKSEGQFVYDDDRTRDSKEKVKCEEQVVPNAELIVRSAINDDIMKLSDAFAKLNSARTSEEEEEKGTKLQGIEVFLEKNALHELVETTSNSDVTVEKKTSANPDSSDLFKNEDSLSNLGTLNGPQENSRSKAEIEFHGQGEDAYRTLDLASTTDEINSGVPFCVNDQSGWDEMDENLPLVKEIDEPVEATTNSETIHECLVSNDEIYPSFRDKTSEEIVLEKTDATCSKLVVNESGWDDWESDNEEGTDMVIFKPVKPPVKFEEEEDGGGWDDWGDEDINSQPQDSEEKKQEIEQHTMTDDGWGDWGDEADLASKPLCQNVPQLGPIGNLPPRALDQKEWSGWDSFGQKKEKDWGLGGWGLNSLLSTATVVTNNLSAVIESGLGVPNPETMARIQMEEKQIRNEVLLQTKEEVRTSEESSGQFPFRHIVAGVGKIVEVAKVQEIGSRVLSGGLDTLETIGKKTMEVLQEGDPGLKRKRALLVNKGQQLSQVLREARDRAAAEDSKAGEFTARRCHFETLFDDFQGLVHLEALEMLSRQCELRLEQSQQNLPPDKLQELLDTLDEVRQLCEVDEDFDNIQVEDFKEAITEIAHPLRNELSVEKIIVVHERLNAWLETKGTSETAAPQIYDEAISAIAELTATITMQFHKSGELLILKERRKTVEEADSLLQLSGHLCSELSAINKRLATLLGARKEPEVEILVSNLRTESENAIAYIKQAFGLLLPVLQLGAT